MKLNYSTSLITSIYIHVILILIIFIHMSSVATQSNEQDDNNAELHEIPEENRKVFIAQIKSHLLKVLGLKEAPHKPHKKALVSKEIIEKWKSLRESTRNTIPNDRDYYGKIPYQIENQDDNFWFEMYNQVGSFDIEVDMGLDESSSEKLKNLHIQGDINNLLTMRLPPESKFPTWMITYAVQVDYDINTNFIFEFHL